VSVRRDSVELRTGHRFTAASFELILSLFDYPTKEATRVTVFLAEQASRVAPPTPELGESPQPFLVPLREAAEMVRGGSIRVSAIALAMLIAAERLCTKA
jgi:hypothetical protein